MSLIPDRSLTRRRILTLAAPAVLTLTPLTRGARAAVGPERRLSLYNIHTGERLSQVYWDDGDYIAPALAEIDGILRDWRTEEKAAMNRDLLDFLNDLHSVMETSEPFHIISGYRSPKTNAKLRDKSKGVARKSLHMRAMAADIALPGRKLEWLREAALSMKRGGVGMYRKSGFIHVDVGRVRFW